MKLKFINAIKVKNKLKRRVKANKKHMLYWALKFTDTSMYISKTCQAEFV